MNTTFWVILALLFSVLALQFAAVAAGLIAG